MDEKKDDVPDPQVGKGTKNVILTPKTGGSKETPIADRQDDADDNGTGWDERWGK
ncbi:MAG: hypothetical protein V4665_03990 [Patescibacteria group bacterium]